MKKLLLVVLMLALFAPMGYAQGMGSVSGTVFDTLNNPVEGARVALMSPGQRRHGGHGMTYHALTGTDGTFSIGNVEPGNYLAMASKMMAGHDEDSISVTAGQNTVVNFVLEGMGGQRDSCGGRRGDSLQIVELAGWAMVVTDSLRTHYFLDINGDDTADFRLQFGPPWYEPNSGATRPNDGDSIWITGGLMGYSTPQNVVVYSINGLFWRTPGRGHGGHGGYGGGYPHPDSVVHIQVSGLAMVEDGPMMDHYFLDTNSDDVADYRLNFGPPNYDPGNGATRPLDGDSVDIVGGLLTGWIGHFDVIIVYEINGQIWWRDPGDTLNLWLSVTSIDDPVTPALPSNYLVAKSYPNPFNPTAFISFELNSSERVTVSVYDLLGREVAILADGVFPAGENQVAFTPDGGSSVYFYKVSAGEKTAVGKMVLLK